MEIKRNIFNTLSDTLSGPEVVILLGARQVGKSTLMERLEVLFKGKREVRKFNLEFPDDLLFFSKSESELFSELTLVPDTILFIDEFHYLKNASKLFKSIYDLKKNIKIIASGSSSLEIHKHLKESLVGRQKIFKVYPLSFSEWKQTKGKLDEFLIMGGMPGLVHINERDEKIEYLSQIVQTYLLKDIKGLIKEENVRAFNHILFFLAENQGQIISTSSMANEVKMTSKTIEHYLNILEQTYVVYGLHSYSNKLSNELKKSRKYYYYDIGVRNSLVKNFKLPKNRKDKGFIYESYVFLELHKKLKANIDLRFWRTKQGDEVDFVWIEDLVPIPIEVKSQYTDINPPKSLIKFMKNYPEAPYGIIFNEDRNEDTTYMDYKIRYRTFENVDVQA